MSLHTEKISLLQQKAEIENRLSLLEAKLKREEIQRTLGFVGEYLRKLTWTPEVTDLEFQIFSWGVEEEEKEIIQTLSQKLNLQEKEQRVLTFPFGDVFLSLEWERIFLTADDPEVLYHLVDAYDLLVENLSHPYEKLNRIRDRLSEIESFCRNITPIKEV